MEFWDVVRNRRSVRQMSSQAVPEELVRKMVVAASWAPSSGNSQPWKFYAVFDPGAKEQLVEATFYNNNFRAKDPQKWLHEAPVLIVICHDILRSRQRYDRVGEMLWGPQDCAAAIENLLLAGTSLGVATCWIGGFRVHEVSEILCLEPAEVPVAIVAAGYPKDANPSRKAPRRELEEIYQRV